MIGHLAPDTASIRRLSHRGAIVTMAQSHEKIARDIVIALLAKSNDNVLGHLFNSKDPTKTGEAIGKVYTAVLQAVKEGAVKPA
jgi:hypothetical protein